MNGLQSITLTHMYPFKHLRCCLSTAWLLSIVPHWSEMILFQIRLVILFVSSLPSSPIDFIFPAQGRCTRENCKYLHPPAHLKTQLEINGRNNLIQQKTAAAMLAQQMQFMIPSTTMQPVVSVWLCATVKFAVLHCKIFEFFKFLSSADIWGIQMLFIVALFH